MCKSTLFAAKPNRKLLGTYVPTQGTLRIWTEHGVDHIRVCIFNNFAPIEGSKKI